MWSLITTGVEQGNPLFPLHFERTIQPLVLDIHCECPEMSQGSYLDDSTFVDLLTLVQRWNTC